MLGLAALVFIRTAIPWTDPLPSWNHDHPKASIVAFVQTAADKRLIAAFDNSDGDLQMLRWAAASWYPWEHRATAVAVALTGTPLCAVGA